MRTNEIQSKPLTLIEWSLNFKKSYKFSKKNNEVVFYKIKIKSIIFTKKKNDCE